MFYTKNHSAILGITVRICLLIRYTIHSKRKAWRLTERDLEGILGPKVCI